MSSSSSSYSATAAKIFNLIFSDSTISQQIQLPTGANASNNIIVNILYTLSSKYTGTPLTLHLTNATGNNALLNINILGNSSFQHNIAPTLNVMLSSTNIIENLPILANDVISYFFSNPSGAPSGYTGNFVISSKDIYNNLVVNYTGRGTGFTGDGFGTGFTGPSLSNPLMTRGNIQSDLPDLLLPYLDGAKTIGFSGVGPNLSDNKIVTTLNLANDLLPYLIQPQVPLSTQPGGNKLVTSYGNANLVSTFFGSLASNPGFVSAVASEIIENDNITSISITNNSNISLVDSTNLSASDIYLFRSIKDYLGYTGGTASTGTSGPVDFTNLTLTPSAAISFISDPFYTELEPSLLVQGNLLNGVIAPPTSTLNRYALVKGLLPMNSYSPGATGATGAFPIFEFIDPNVTILSSTGYTGYTGATGIYLPNSTGLIAFKTQSPKITFPCTAYGLIDKTPNSYAYTIPSITYPSTIINAMLPLYTELAVAAGLVFENEVSELKNEIDQITNNLGMLGALTNYLQAYSENIYVVGLYTSTITINGNGAPIGYSYYNGYGYTGTTGDAPSVWTQSLYTPPPPTLNLNGFLLPPKDGTTSTNVQTTDFVGTNTCTTIPNQIIYPINNTIIIPFSYKGFGYIGNAPGSCNHPQYVLSINLNNIYYQTGSPPNGYSNGYVIQQGTTVKICNESNYIVQLTSRNLTYSGAYPTTSSVPSTILPVPASPFVAYSPITPPPDANPPNANSGYSGVTGPNGWPFTTGYTDPIGSGGSGDITINTINLRDTTSDVIYIKAGDSIRLVFSQNTNSNNGGTWGYL